MKQRSQLLAFCLSLSILPTAAAAQWLTDGTPVCQATGNQIIPSMTRDGGIGFIIAWQDDRNGDGDVYAQKIDLSGVTQWDDAGMPVCLAVGSQNPPVLVLDGSEGAILAWLDFRGGGADIYAQRLDADGNPLWATDGIAVCTAAGTQDLSTRGSIVRDGTGGTIIVWSDPRSLTNRIYAQKISDDGVPLWTSNGVEVSTSAGGPQVHVVAITDGAGGAMIVWSDRRTFQYDIYAQRVNDLGQPQWNVGTTNAIVLCSFPGPQSFPVMTTDGAGGFIAAWLDYRAMNYDIYAMRVNSAGVLQWPAFGAGVCGDPNDQNEIAISANGFGGAMLVWQDERPVADSSYDIYAQSLSPTGNGLWTDGGVPVCTDPLTQELPKIVDDGNSGAIIAWSDRREGEWDAYAQHINAFGSSNWVMNGVPVSSASGDQNVTALVSDGTDGAIVAWYDGRDNNFDIYAQHLSDEANSVAITFFEATVRDGAVLLQSRFRSDVGVEGVTVYRGVREGPLAPIDHIGSANDRGFTYEDTRVTPGETYRYQIGVTDADGEFFSAIETVTIEAVALQLEQNRPNPFNPSTTIHFVLPARERVRIDVFDAHGVKVRTVMDDVRDHGGHDVVWDGRDDQGVPASSGVYFYRLLAGKHAEAKKMILLK